MTNKEILTAINTCDYLENGAIICPDEHLTAMLAFIAHECNGWYECTRYEKEGFHYITHDVEDDIWMNAVKALKKKN